MSFRDVEAVQDDFLARRDHSEELKALNFASLEKAWRIPHNYADRISVIRGSIIDQAVDVIVNAANELLTGGGGVDGVIHQACGPDLLQECLKIPLNSLGARCMPGEAILTKSFRIHAKYIIHTVGPYLDENGRTQPSLLFNCYWNSLILAEKQELRSIAFPAISTGYYGYPIAESCEVALRAIDSFFMEHPNSPLKIRLVLYDELSFKIYSKILL